MYRPGKDGGKPDALLWRAQDMPDGEEDNRKSNQDEILLKTHQLDDELKKVLASIGIWDGEGDTSIEDNSSEADIDEGDTAAVEEVTEARADNEAEDTSIRDLDTLFEGA